MSKSEYIIGYMNKVQCLCERYGRWMLLFSLLFTFAYAFFYELDISNHDYLFYMHYVDEGNIENHAMVAGTIWFSNPLWTLFGRRLWMWKIWAWCMASLTAVIPYFSLLKKEQRHKYAYVMALVILVLNLRYGLEPPKYAYLFNVLMLTVFIKYLQTNKIGWLVSVSVCVALITFVRFPSIFVWPVIIVAMILSKRDWKHTLLVLALPMIFWGVMVTITNGGIGSYFENLLGHAEATVSESHSLVNLFRGYVVTTTHAAAYMTMICLPLLFWGIWKRKDNAVVKVGVVSSLLLILVIMFIHPTEHLSCAMTMAALVICAYCRCWNWNGIVLGATIVIANMFCSIGSNCGFVHDYYCVCFLPFFLITSNGTEQQEKKQSNTRTHYLDMEYALPMFVTLVMVLYISTLTNKIYVLGDKYRSGIVNGRELSTNLNGVYFAKKSMQKYYDLQKIYGEQERVQGNVIYWGTHSTHLMAFINNQWPVTDIWDISNRDINNKAFKDFSRYIIQNKPAVVDLERHQNTELFMESQGYRIKKSNLANIYTLEE